LPSYANYKMYVALRCTQQALLAESVASPLS
jgi:hypothetical protein